VPVEVPALQGDDRTPNLQGQPDLREGPVLPADGYDHVSRTDYRQITCLARARRDGVLEVGVGPSTVLVRQDADGDAPLPGRAARRGLHHAREAATDHDTASGSDEPPDLSRELLQLSRGFAGSHDRDVERTVHADASLTRGSGAGRGRSRRSDRCSGASPPTPGCPHPPRQYAKPPSRPCPSAPSPGRPS
jgi:hypothetical protein